MSVYRKGSGAGVERISAVAVAGEVVDSKMRCGGG